MAGMTAQEAYQKFLDDGTYINHPGAFASEEEWANYKHMIPQQAKKDFRAKVRGNEQRAIEGMSQGLTRNQMGIYDQKEMGQALYRRLGMYAPGMDMGWNYDWDRGIATNVGTSDLSKRGKETRAITPEEMQRHRDFQAAGSPEAYYSGYRSAQIRDLINRGAITPDGQGGYMNPGGGGHYGSALQGYNLGQDVMGNGRGTGRSGGYDPGQVNLGGGGPSLSGYGGPSIANPMGLSSVLGNGGMGWRGGLITSDNPDNRAIPIPGSGPPAPGTPQGNQPRPEGPISDGGIPGDGRAVPQGTGGGGVNVYNQSNYQPSLQEQWLMQEMARQSRMDSLMQGFDYDRAAQEYAQAGPLEDYMLDFYGDILGVDFNLPSFSLNDYFAEGMMPSIGMGASAAGPNGLPYGNIPGQGPQPGPSPKGQNIPGTPWYNPATQGEPAQLGQSMAGPGLLAPDPGIPRDGTNDTGIEGGPGEAQPWGPGPGNPHSPYGQPGSNQGGAPGNPGNQVPQAVSPWSPGWTNLPEMPKGSYTPKQGEALNAANRRTWGLLAPQAESAMQTADAALQRLRSEAPEGGQTNQARGEILKGVSGNINSMRQDLVNQAIAGVSGLAGAKKGYNPAGYSGAGQGLLSSYDSRRGQDMSNSLGWANFGLDQQKFDFDKSQANKKPAWWEGLLSGLGGVGAAWAGSGFRFGR